MPYGVSPTPPDLLEAWSRPNEAAERCLKLPGPNIFIPDDFSLVCDRDSDGGGAVEGGGEGEGEGATATKVVDPEEGFEEETRGERGSRGRSEFDLQLSVNLWPPIDLWFFDTPICTVSTLDSFPTHLVNGYGVEMRPIDRSVRRFTDERRKEELLRIVRCGGLFLRGRYCCKVQVR